MAGCSESPPGSLEGPTSGDADAVGGEGIASGWAAGATAGDGVGLELGPAADAGSGASKANTSNATWKTTRPLALRSRPRAVN